jgi:hypothetical protein
MSNTCPTCGQQIGIGADKLLDLLRHGVPKREVYKGQDGRWYVTYGGGGPISDATVRSLVERKLIQRTYATYDGSFQVGPTIDIGATQERRKREGKKAPLVYVEAPLAVTGG